MKTILLATVSALLLTGLTFAEPASNLSFQVQATGQLNDADRVAAQWLVAQANAQITAANAALAEGETPTPLFPDGSPADIRTSALTILAQTVANAWASYVVRSAEEETAPKEEWIEAIRNATPEARAAALQNLRSNQVPQK